MLFDARLCQSDRPASVVDYYRKHRVCVVFENKRSERVIAGRVQYLRPVQPVELMRERQAQGRYNVAANPMAYCLPDVRQRMAIVHLSAGALPTQVEPSRHERVDRYWLYLEQARRQGQPLAQLSRFGDW